MTALTDVHYVLEDDGFIGGLNDYPKGWGRAHISSCESQHRLDLAHNSDEDDEVFYAVRIKGDSEDLFLEVQARAWVHRSRKREVIISGLLTRNGHIAAYWAAINLQGRFGNLRMSEEDFAKIGFSPELMSAF